MTMDFSQLHTYTPPQCAPDNTGYTYSLSSSYSTAALEFEQEHQIDPVYDSPRMSRRSLRLKGKTSHHGDESQVEYSQNPSGSYTRTTRETRVLRSKLPQTTSSAITLSLSQSSTPRKNLCFPAASTPICSSSSNFLENYTETDAYQLTSALDQSHLRQRTVTTRTSMTTDFLDGHRDQSAIHSSSSTNGAASTSKSHTSTMNGYLCKNCLLHSQKTDSLIMQSSSQSTSSSPATQPATDMLFSSSSPFTSIYTRDRSRKKSGFLVTVSNGGVHYGKKAMASVVSLVTTIFSCVAWMGSKVKSQSSKGIHKAHSSFCGSMNVKELMNEDESHLNLNGSLCDDCKGKQYSQTHSPLLKQPSRSHDLVQTRWSVLSKAGHLLRWPGYYVIGAGRALGSGAGSVAQSLLTVLWMLVSAPVTAGKRLFWLLATGWYQLVYLMSVLNVFFLTRCLPKLWKLLWLLLPLLLLLALWLWGPSIAALLAYLPAINLIPWRSTTSSVLEPAPTDIPVLTSESQMLTSPSTPVSHTPPILPPGTFSGVDLKRLENVERQFALLWEHVHQRDQKEEKHHADHLGLYSTLKEQLHTQTNKESLAIWVSSLLEQRLVELRGELDQQNTLRAQSAEERLKEGQATRLADLELLLKTLSVKTEEVHQKQQQFEHKAQTEEQQVVASPTDTAFVSVGTTQEDHNALLAEVQRLELELGQIRHDLQGVMGCKGKCEQLNTLQETISSQVTSQMRKELQAVFFGNVGSSDEQGEVPESLILWLSQRYVSTPDLQASLASLELNILRNISQQLEQSRSQTLREAEFEASKVIQTVTGSVQHTSRAEGLSEEQVKLIVQNALKLYSHDRTGLVDYALESGGGSILSTRCSETYETKTALMSLFGLPLWYFSQSPRVVIQPDVYPGNCWAFKGSQGYLVIRLSMSILPTSFCVEHIPKSLSPTGNITSAPRNFTVYGLDDEYQEEGKLLGQYMYQDDGESLQTFPVQEHNDKAFQIIEVRVLSNWGHPEYTCLYRFRVHGTPHPQ